MTPGLVHYVIGHHMNGEEVIRPAILVRIYDGVEAKTAYLQVFADAFDDVKYTSEASKGAFAVAQARHSDKWEVGTWHDP